MSEHENLISREVVSSPLRKYELRIEQDPDSESPRMWDNMGSLFTRHRRYDWTDDGLKHSDHGEILARVKTDGGIILPVYLLDHSGLALSTSPFNDMFDSGQVGVIYATRDVIAKEFGSVTEETMAKTREILRAEIDTLNQYVNSEVYMFSIVDDQNDILESVGGFYGFEYCRNEAREIMNRIVANDKMELRQTMDKEFIAAKISPHNAETYEIVPARFIRPDVGRTAEIVETPGDMSNPENIVRWGLYVKTDQGADVCVADAMTFAQAENSVVWRNSLLGEIRDNTEESPSPGM